MNCFSIADLAVPSAAAAMVVSSFSTASPNKTTLATHPLLACRSAHTTSITFNRLLSLSVLDRRWNCFSIIIIKGGNFFGRIRLRGRLAENIYVQK